MPLYVSCISDVLDVHAPTRETLVKVRRKHLWYNDSVHDERKKRRRLQRKWKHTRTSDDRQAYEIQCSHVVDIIRQSKQANYRYRLSVSPKDDRFIADSFAVYFTDKVKKNFDAECVSCHVVGLKEKGGFVSKQDSPHLKGVQCENCHGPRREHIKNPQKKVLGHKITACSSCHHAPHTPDFKQEHYWPKIAHGFKKQDQ